MKSIVPKYIIGTVPSLAGPICQFGGIATDWRIVAARLCAVLWLACSIVPGLCQPVSLSVQASNGQVRVAWPGGLSLVQPQKRTNLTSGAWQDWGAATSATNVGETVGVGPAYYRLRFLTPSITSQPQGQINSIGSNVTFNVTATGTASLTYQWRKETAPLTGKTNASLVLSNLVTNDAGNYTVVVANRAGGTTSLVAVLSVTNPLARPFGIYMGTFAGQADSGGFALMVRSNGLAYIVGYNTPQDEGVFASGFSVTANGTFYTATAQGGKVGGGITPGAVSGNFTNSTGQTGSYSGNRQPDTGIHASDVGYYAGTYNGFRTGSAYAIVAADGSIFFFTTDASGDGGGFGTINAANTFSGTTVPDNLPVTGTLNPTTHVLSGTYSSGGMFLGNFTVTRTLTL